MAKRTPRGAENPDYSGSSGPFEEGSELELAEKHKHFATNFASLAPAESEESSRAEAKALNPSFRPTANEAKEKQGLSEADLAPIGADAIREARYIINQYYPLQYLRIADLFPELTFCRKIKMSKQQIKPSTGAN